MADGSKPPKGQVAEELIIVRRGAPEEPAGKGGAWKIAYADFVTAMMAFFLVMWLINAANEKTKAQVASYFNPVKLVDNTTYSKGIKTPGDRTANSSGQKGGDAAPNEEAVAEKAEHAPAEKPAEEKGEPAAKAEGKAAEKSEKAAELHGNSAEEAAMFEDPFKLLSQIAREAPPLGGEGRSDKTMVIKEIERVPSGQGAMTRDPFDPLAWKMVPPVGREQIKEEKSEEDQPKAKDEKKEEAKKTEPDKVDAKQESGEKPETVDKMASGQEPDTGMSAAGRVALQEAEQIRTSLSEELSSLGTKHPELQVKTTKEGVLISLTDSASFDMFDVGSAKPRPVVVKLMEKVAAAVKDFKGNIIVRGHTDGRPYRGRGYDNWRLSMARAQMAYYMLIRAGVDENSVERIEGYADKSLLNSGAPESAENRRIEILLRVSDS